MQESHWNYFLAIEGDLENLSRYIELREDNFATYSIETAKILMAASQEVDVLFKAICRHHKARAERIGDYYDLMKKKHPAIFDADVRLVHHALVRVPYEGWTNGHPPAWWTANNEVKHARDTNFNSASLVNVIDAVGALLLVNICSHVIIRGERNLKPRRDTRLFVPGMGWTSATGPVYGRCYAIPGENNVPSSLTPPPTDSLGVYVTDKISGSIGQIALNLRIDNGTSERVDMSTVTLRYWYQDEGLGTNLVLAPNYVSIGMSNQGKVTSGTAVANPSPVAGADHYLELAFTGTLAAQGDKSSNDQFNIQVTLHTANYRGAVNVTNDYSYNGGAIGYNDKITLHDKNGKVIWGTPPG
jgi:Cellulose binding domain.